MSKHTPTPWRWVTGYDTLTYPHPEGPATDGLYGPNDEPVVYGIWRNDGEADCGASEEDARFIVLAVNSHEALLAAAKLTVLHFKRNQVSGNFQGDDEHEAWTALQRAIEAAAEGADHA